MNRFIIASIAARRSSYEMGSRTPLARRFTTVGATDAGQRTARGTITLAERAALRAARKERATKFMAEQQKTTDAPGGGSGGSTRTNLATSHYIWYLSVGIPAGLLIWGFNDENSPPAQFCRVTGITDFVRSYTDVIAQPAHNKLLPDWSQVRWIAGRL
jgi:hypothetical protein